MTFSCEQRELCLSSLVHSLLPIVYILWKSLSIVPSVECKQYICQIVWNRILTEFSQPVSHDEWHAQCANLVTLTLVNAMPRMLFMLSAPLIMIFLLFSSNPQKNKRYLIRLNCLFETREKVPHQHAHHFI